MPAKSVRTERSNFDVSEAGFVAVIGQEDMAFDFGAKAGNRLELAFGDRRFDFLAAQFIFENFDPIEPMFDVVALH